MVDKLTAALAHIEWEVIFVDNDSPDYAAKLVRELAASNRRVRCNQRIGRRGLSTAVIEGMFAGTAPYLAVMDSDLQHDERLLPEMLKALKREKLDLVIGSRYVKGGGVGQWDGNRAAMSSFATSLARLIIHEPLSDPVSGFFVITRPALNERTPALPLPRLAVFLSQPPTWRE